MKRLLTVLPLILAFAGWAGTTEAKTCKQVCPASTTCACAYKNGSTCLDDDSVRGVCTCRCVKERVYKAPKDKVYKVPKDSYGGSVPKAKRADEKRSKKGVE